MSNKKATNAYIWYSNATDVTGIKLAKALNMKHGKNKPDISEHNLVIGWGTKLDESVSLGKLKTINHPNCILTNRNKLNALRIMHKSGVNIANFVDSLKVITDVLANKDIKLPLIGRTKYHQGGKGFWICPTMTHIKAAIDDGAQYFQNMIEISDEYRLHIFNNEVIHAVRKSKRTKKEYEDHYVKDELEHQKNLAEKNNNSFDEPTAKLILERMAKKKTAGGADMIIRSNKLGWKFSHVKTVNEDLKKEAIKAIKSLNLDFGAVDCCLDVNNTPYVIEINTGPGLEETPFTRYVEAFENAIRGSKPTLGTFDATRKEMLTKTALITELIQSADESEAKALKGVFRKMFS